MSLQKLFLACAETLNESRPIEKDAKRCLQQAKPKQELGFGPNNLPPQIQEIMRRQDALPLCDMIRQMAFHWSPPTTSASSKYIKDSRAKSHVELVGPEGLALSDNFRIGLYGMMANSAYGIRTHPAEEIISCWQVKYFGRWAQVNIDRIMPGRALIILAIWNMQI